MSDLTVATNDLESDGLKVGYVVLEGNLETAPTVELEGDLEVGIGGGVESSDLLKIKGMTKHNKCKIREQLILLFQV